MKASAQVLGPTCYRRPVLEVAPALLGCLLCRATPQGVLRWPISETEAYDGPHDLACHAHKGRTRRTEVMFREGGVWYVYFCYGVHWMLNIVTGPAEYPAAVLIRGAGEVSGPGRLTRALGITGDVNGMPATRSSGLWIERGEPVDPERIRTSPRIGVDYAGPDWSRRHYRFHVAAGGPQA